MNDVADVIALDGHTLRVQGHRDLLERGPGVRPVRIPECHWWQVSPGWLGVTHLYSEGSGVRLAGTTSATNLRLRVRCTQRFLPGGIGSHASSFVLTVDGERFAARPTPVTAHLIDPPLSDGLDLRTLAEEATVEFTGLPAGQKLLEVWLPQTMVVDLLGVEADAPVVAAPEPTQPRWTHYGSSISHCAEADDPLAVWPVVTAREVGLDVTNLGLRGACMLEPFLAETIAETPADVISLKVGINLVGGRTMSDRTFVPALHGLLDRIRASQPDVPVVLVSAISWPGSENLPGPSTPVTGADGVVRQRAGGEPVDVAGGALTLARSRDLVQHVAMVRASRGENIHYLDGRALYGPQDQEGSPLPDGLHPSSASYVEMGHRFARLVFGDGGLVPVQSLTRG
ncbi:MULTISPECIES: GDSL-type esterase/lipase family protein [unclassified Luteococcus]|uniref:GDSL-type esterase/lipase family protein n=1 Tax=unclassified Luteococcus TaxID=2639923 RepID=UPI00313D8016